MYLTTKAFWAATAERAVKTLAQAAVAAAGADAMDLFHTNWVGVSGIALGAALLSVLASLAAPSLVTKTAVPPSGDGAP